MTIIVGTDTYISLADARTYVAKFGLTPLPMVDAEAEALLVRATSSMDRIYGNKYLGQKLNISQPLAWPRLVSITPVAHYIGEYLYVTYDSDGNPRDFQGLQPELGWAQTELAVGIQAGTNVFEQPAPAIKRSTEKVSTLEETIEYSSGNGYKSDFLYNISLILRPLLITNLANISITRGA